MNVISLTTLVESIPLTVKLWYLKTDMQGFDFDASPSKLAATALLMPHT